MLDPDTYRTVLEILPNGVYVVDRERRIRFWNDGARRITGYPSQEVIGRCCQDDLLMHCDIRGQVLCGSDCPLAGTMHDGRPREIDVLLRHRNGERVPVRMMAVALRDGHGTIVGAVETFDEPFPAPESTGAIAGNEDAAEDPLTGMPLRPAIESQIEAAVQDFESQGRPCAVVSLAIDRLDQFQHSYGLLAAEALVRSAAHTLARSAHAGGIVGRWSPERFVVVLRDCPEAALAEAAERMRQTVGLAAISWWGDHLSSTVSAGASSVQAGDTAGSLLGRSEEALLRCLQEGGDRVALG